MNSDKVINNEDEPQIDDSLSEPGNDKLIVTHTKLRRPIVRILMNKKKNQCGRPKISKNQEERSRSRMREQAKEAIINLHRQRTEEINISKEDTQQDYSISPKKENGITSHSDPIIKSYQLEFEKKEREKNRFKPCYDLERQKQDYQETDPIISADPIIQIYRQKFEQKEFEDKKQETKNRKPGAGRPLKSFEMDNYILKELEDKANRERIAPRKKYMILLAKEWKEKNPYHPYTLSGFSHSNGWSDKFWIRNLDRIRFLKRLAGISK